MPAREWDKVRTLESYVAREQRMHPQSRGVFSDLLRRIGVASKIIASKVNKAGLITESGSYGHSGRPKPGQRMFHLMANDIMKASLRWVPAVAGTASRDEDDVTPYPPRDDMDARYIVVYDALDGSSNIDVNVSAGTIFAIFRCPAGTQQPELDDFLQPGYKAAAAGYIIYGSSSMFVFTTGQGVHGFTLDPDIGEYILSHENILIPADCICFSANESHYDRWDEPTRRFADLMRFGDDPRYSDTSSRYIGSLVADFHRNLFYGGLFLYPADTETGKGKLRLLFECAPLAMIADQAGGLATTGRESILDIRPTELHQRVPLVTGNREAVEHYERMIRDDDIAKGLRKPSTPPA
jgi:fructose-1,6-bisphosphatase I